MNKQLSGKNRLVVICAIAIVMQLTVFSSQGYAKLRKAKVGDKMPEFSMMDENRELFIYPHKAKALVLVFLSEQKESKLAVSCFEEILNTFGDSRGAFDFVAVTNDPNNSDLLEYLQMQSQPNYRILIDKEFDLWGKLGVVATPTVLIADKSGEIVWIKAGYGYDFVPAVKQNLGAALGSDNEPNQASIAVKTLKHNTVQARAVRHLRMSKMLEDKGRTESALKEAQKALDLDPNSVNAALVVGRLYCKSGKNEEAIEAVSRLEPESYRQKAEMNLILGWASRQSDNIANAEKYLIESVKLNPKSARSHYELGKTYEAKGDILKAMESYRRALAKIFAEPDYVLPAEKPANDGS